MLVLGGVGVAAYTAYSLLKSKDNTPASATGAQPYIMPKIDVPTGTGTTGNSANTTPNSTTPTSNNTTQTAPSDAFSPSGLFRKIDYNRYSNFITPQALNIGYEGFVNPDTDSRILQQKGINLVGFTHVGLNVDAKAYWNGKMVYTMPPNFMLSSELANDGTRFAFTDLEEIKSRVRNSYFQDYAKIKYLSYDLENNGLTRKSDGSYDRTYVPAQYSSLSDASLEGVWRQNYVDRVYWIFKILKEEILPVTCKLSMWGLNPVGVGWATGYSYSADINELYDHPENHLNWLWSTIASGMGGANKKTVGDYCDWVGLNLYPTTRNPYYISIQLFKLELNVKYLLGKGKDIFGYLALYYESEPANLPIRDSPSGSVLSYYLQPLEYNLALSTALFPFFKIKNTIIWDVWQNLDFVNNPASGLYAGKTFQEYEWYFRGLELIASKSYMFAGNPEYVTLQVSTDGGNSFHVDNMFQVEQSQRPIALGVVNAGKLLMFVVNQFLTTSSQTINVKYVSYSEVLTLNGNAPIFKEVSLIAI